MANIHQTLKQVAALYEDLIGTREEITRCVEEMQRWQEEHRAGLARMQEENQAALVDVARIGRAVKKYREEIEVLASEVRGRGWAGSGSSGLESDIRCSGEFRPLSRPHWPPPAVSPTPRWGGKCQFRTAAGRGESTSSGPGGDPEAHGVARRSGLASARACVLGTSGSSGPGIPAAVPPPARPVLTSDRVG